MILMVCCVTSAAGCAEAARSTRQNHMLRCTRLLRASTNRNQLDETYSILRYSGEISYRFIAAFRGAENSSEAIRSISLFNLRLLTSSRTAAFSSFVLASLCVGIQLARTI